MLNKKLVLTSAFVVMAFAQSFAADLNSLIPAKANLIAKFNIEKICAIPELKAKFEEFKASQPVANTSTTDELYKDTKSAMFFLDLDTANNTDQNNIFAGALLDGKYDVSKITEAIKKDLQKMQIFFYYFGTKTRYGISIVKLPEVTVDALLASYTTRVKVTGSV